MGIAVLAATALSAPPLVDGAAAQGLGQDSAGAPVITAHDLPRNDRYAGRTRWSRLQTDITYVDRLEGEIPLDGRAPPRPGPEDQGGPEDLPTLKWLSRALLAAVAIVLVAVLWRYRHAILTRTGRDGAAATARGNAPALNAQSDGPDARLVDRLLAMADRRQALVLLTGAVLDAAARANGLRLGSAETAREFLRRLPGDWHHLSALKRLVMTEELVQFGGRPLPEPTFVSCVEAARPILAAAATEPGR